MFQFRRFPSYSYLIHCMIHELLSCGLLHSDICGSFHACRSPQLFAAYHVLLRLPMPRHSPCALISLTIWIMSSNFKLVFAENGFLYHFPPFAIIAVVQTIVCTNTRFKSFDSCRLFSSFALLFKLLFNFQAAKCKSSDLHTGHKWTRTIDLTLIRRAL